MRSLPYRLFGISLLFCTVLLGCAVTEDAAYVEKVQQARAALEAKRYHEVLSLLYEIDKDAEKRRDKEYYLMQGLASFKLGDYRRAVDALEKAQPYSLQLHMYMAYLHLLLGDAQRATSIAAALELQYGQHPEIAILKGNISLKEHAYQKAEQHFRLASVLDRSSVKAYIGLANTYLLQRHFLKAEEHYLKAVILSKDDTSAYISLLNYYIVTGRYDDAEYTTSIALSKYPDDINILMVKSNLYLTMGKTPEGLYILEKALGIFPHSVDLKIRLIRSYFNLNRLDDAYRLAQNLLIDDNYHGLILLAEYHLRKNETDMALFHLNRAQLMNNSSYFINYYLGLIYLIKNKTKFAVRFLEKSIQNFPGFKNSHILLSIVYTYQGKYELASEHAKLVLQLDPSNINAHLINGIALYLQDYFNEAKYEFDITSFFASHNKIAPVIQMIIALEMKDFDQLGYLLSDADYRSLEKLFLQMEIFKIQSRNIKGATTNFDTYGKNSPNYLTFILLANFYKENNDLESSKDYFLKAKASNEGIVIPYYGLAELEAMQGNRAAAIAYLQQAIERQRSFVKAYTALGSLYERVKDYQNAKLIYENGLRYAPEDSVLLNNLAWVNLVHLGDRSAAYIGIRKALSLAPEDPDIQDTLAWWYYLNDDHQHALPLLKRIVEANPANPLYRYHLGMVYLKAGEKQEARFHLQKAVELGIDDEHKAAIMELIK